MKNNICRSLVAVAALSGSLVAVSNAMAALLTITIAPLTLTGVGACTGPDLNTTTPNAPVPDSSGHCWDLATFPVEPLADQIILTGDTYPLVDPTFPLSPGHLTYTFIPGLTGGGSAGPESEACDGGVDNPFSLNRAITVNGVVGTLTQSGNLRVGWCFDTLNISLGTATIENVPDFGTVTVTVGGVVDLEASLDPEGELEVSVNASAVPLPSTLALLGLGLAGFAARRRRRLA